MNRLKHTYFNTYYYANIVSNILKQDPDTIGFISSFFDNPEIWDQLVKSFQKKSAFHLFIEHIVGEFLDDDMHDHDSKDYHYCTLDSNGRFTPYAEIVLENYGMSDSSFDNSNIKSYADVEEFHTELYESGILQDLYEKIADEIFYIMFNNRYALLEFNFVIAQHIQDIVFSDNEESDIERYFTKAGTLKRVPIPEWCKKAVFFRDRGHCCLCNKDLSGTLSINNKKHYDHIIPLAQGGLNDIANIQMLCDSCNTNKGGHRIATSDWYESWY
jgi:hypothetical protein